MIDKEESAKHKNMLDSYFRYNLYHGPDKDKIDSLVVLAYEEFVSLLNGVDNGLYGDLLSATNNQSRHHLENGDYISNPVAAFGDGDAFGEDINRRTGIHFEIKIVLDCSSSMNDSDGIIRDYKQGSDSYNKDILSDEAKQNPILAVPRIFAASLVARVVLLSMKRHISNLSLASDIQGFCFGGGRVTPYNGEVYVYTPLGGGTPTLPVFKEMRRSEIETGYYNANRLDLFITDGGISSYDLDKVDDIQIQRLGNGTVNTIFLNILPETVYRKDFENENDPRRLPKYVRQFNTSSPIMLAHTIQYAVKQQFQI